MANVNLIYSDLGVMTPYAYRDDDDDPSWVFPGGVSTVHYLRSITDATPISGDSSMLAGYITTKRNPKPLTNDALLLSVLANIPSTAK